MSYEEYTVKVSPKGTKFWYQNGHRHRLDGPAIEWSDGDKFWYQNGNRHRLDGPAIEYANGDKRWYIEGLEYTKEEFEQKINPTKEMTVEQIAKELGYKVKVIEG